ATVSYTATTADLRVSRSGNSFVTVSLTQNQQAVSSGIDAIEAIDPTNTLVTAITPLNAAQARDAFDELHGDTLQAPARSASRAGLQFTRALSQRSSRLGLASRGEGQSETRGATSVVEGVWVEAVQIESEGKADNQVGSAAYTHEGQVMTLGLDGYWSDDVIVGFALGQSESDLAFTGRTAKGSTTGVFAGAYTRFETRSGMHFKLAASLAQNEADMTRTIGITNETARGTVKTSSANFVLEAGFGLHVGNFGLRPFALAGLQLLERESVRESGAVLGGLVTEAEDNMLGEVGLGLELSRPWLTRGNRWAQVSGSVAIMQPVGETQFTQNTRFNGTTPTFTVADTPDEGTTLAISVGGEVYLSRGFALWGGYDGRISSASDDHGLQLSLRYRW
ncbi:MAG: autotransporter outer membrane beta-barrel domain-containing protein, partial [Moraxellaceae bacterium]|nr:autotransporter outer membrane beta-barrel domain-containing protein [Moraxellaceae bacterium]